MAYSITSYFSSTKAPALPRPDPKAFANPAVSSSSPGSPWSSPVKGNPQTPPQPKTGITSISPNIQASPDLPHSMAFSHSAEQLATAIENREFRRTLASLEKKRTHSVALTDSVMRHSDVLRQETVAAFVSRASKALFQNPSLEIAPMDAGDDIQVSISEPDKPQIHDRRTGKKRTFSYHRHDGGKTIFPVSGDNILLLKKGATSPKKLKAAVTTFRANPVGKPADFIEKFLTS